MRQTRATLTVIYMNNVLMTLGFGIWQAIFNNFAVEELGVRADQIGLIQSIREIPGLMGFLIGAVALILAETRIAGLSMILMGAGISLTAATHQLPGLIAATLLMSIGFHFFYSSNASALLLTVAREEGPRALGRLNSLGALATGVSTLLIFATLGIWGYRRLFLVAGAVVIVGGLVLSPLIRQPVRARGTDRRAPLHRNYWLYYVLQFLNGSRRHIVTTFAVFLLVREYNVTAQIITLLFLLNSMVGTYLHQAFGNIVARYGERRVLSLNYALLVLVFLSYAAIPNLGFLSEPSFEVPGLSIGRWVFFPSFPATPGLLILLAVFVLDRVLIGFSIAVEAYLQKIALGPEDVTPNVALGQTINHIAAVVVPVTGGVIWETVGAQYTFLGGTAIVLAALVLTQRMHIPQPALVADATRPPVPSAEP